MWLLLVFRNLKSFIRTKPVLFFFMLLSQAVCVVSALAVAGMVDAVTPVPEDKRGYSSLSFFLEFNRNTENKTEQKNGVSLFDIKQKKFLYVGEDNEEADKIRQSIRNTPSENDIYESNFLLSAKSPPFLTYGNMKEKINTVRESCQNELASIHFGGYIEEDGLVSVHFKAEKHDNEWLKKNRPYLYGKSHQISLRRNPYYESPFQKLSVGDTVTVGHTEYIVSHIENGDAWNIATALTINPEAADDSFIINYVTFTVKSETNQAGIAKVSKGCFRRTVSLYRRTAAASAHGETIQSYGVCAFVYHHCGGDIECRKTLYLCHGIQKKSPCHIFRLRCRQKQDICPLHSGNRADTVCFLWIGMAPVPFCIDRTHYGYLSYLCRILYTPYLSHALWYLSRYRTYHYDRQYHSDNQAIYP